jgi:hypothetical protein
MNLPTGRRYQHYYAVFTGRPGVTMPKAQVKMLLETDICVPQISVSRHQKASQGEFMA